ncbi:copper-binding protein [Tolumonas osonensis]|uniref:Cu/Ag efflux protein CusF n=1 Tax=Tolumonas osonensis TaxID=675874 RepID=A0A841GG79_9GAMM|nr:copper-binding protein [Tolumonas osonensis]MBB6056587.1 Cu/Ag efflux protein CusF [Tolumonas osonensis]
MKKSLSRITAVALFSLFAATAAQAAVETYRAHGTVQQVDAANGKVVLAQDAVTELGWPVRTMTYKVHGDKTLQGISAGQTVDVTFTTTSPYQAAIQFITPVSQ